MDTRLGFSAEDPVRGSHMFGVRVLLSWPSIRDRGASCKQEEGCTGSHSARIGTLHLGSAFPLQPLIIFVSWWFKLNSWQGPFRPGVTSSLEDKKESPDPQSQSITA